MYPQAEIFFQAFSRLGPQTTDWVDKSSGYSHPLDALNTDCM